MDRGAWQVCGFAKSWPEHAHTHPEVGSGLWGCPLFLQAAGEIALICPMWLVLTNKMWRCHFQIERIPFYDPSAGDTTTAQLWLRCQPGSQQENCTEQSPQNPWWTWSMNKEWTISNGEDMKLFITTAGSSLSWVIRRPIWQYLSEFRILIPLTLQFQFNNLYYFFLQLHTCTKWYMCKDTHGYNAYIANIGT